MPDLQPETKLALNRSGSPLVVVKVELIARLDLRRAACFRREARKTVTATD